MTEYLITLNNQKISEFYKKNPSMDIETNNLLFIDLFENVLQQGATLNKSLSTQILNEISGLNTKINSMQNTLSSDLILKFLEIKKEYIEDMKTIIGSSTVNTTDKINTLIEKNNSHLIDKTTLLLNDIIPRSQETQYHQIQDKLTSFYQLINADTKQLLSQNNGNSVSVFQDFISNFDSKYSSMIHTIQNSSEERITNNINSLKETSSSALSSQEKTINELSDFISNFETKYSAMIHTIQNSSEDRITKNINSLRETSTTSLSTQEKTMNDLSDFLSKYKNSTQKGQIGENKLFSVLTNMFPSAEIIDTSSIKASCDFLLKRENADNILFETKLYNQNIPSDEIKKFIRDCDTQSSNGIFLSHNSGFALKSNYHIDIHKSNILVYVHNVEYQPYRIQIAIDIIDTLSNKLKDFNQDEDEENTISKEMVEDINTDYQSFIEQKESMYTILRDFNKRMGSQIDNIALPCLDRYLSTKFASTAKKGIHCEICNNFSAPTNKSLSAHKRACKLIHKNEKSTGPANIVVKSK